LFLTAIAFDEATGKIATCTERSVRIYRPYGQNEEALRVSCDSTPKNDLSDYYQWSLQISIQVDDLDQPVTTLSWGGIRELLVGGLALSLYSTEDDVVKIWSKAVANPTKFACLSYDSRYIASTGPYDRLVKLWRRLSFGSDDVRFDLTYLPHPQMVTNVRWRRPYHHDQTVDNVLYTVCADKTLRIWAATDTHGLQIFQLWGQINLEESIQPRSLVSGKTTKFRYTSFIDGRDFGKLVEHSVQTASDPDAIHNHVVEHLVEVANRSHEICVIFDEQGNMSAWGLENIGGKARKPTDIFNIAHVAGLEPMLPQPELRGDAYIQLYTYCSRTDGMLNTIWHNFDGTIQHFNSSLAKLFESSLRPSCTTPRAIWTGHSRAVKKMVRNISGRAVVSRTDGNEAIVWRHEDDDSKVPLTAQSLINVLEHIHRICVLRRGAFVILLHHTTIALWDCRRHRGRRLASLPYAIPGRPLCVLVLPETERRGDTAHIATISSEMKGIVWELRLPSQTNQDSELSGDGSMFIREFCTFDLGNTYDLAYVLPVDPAGSPPVTSGSLDTFARDVAVSYTLSGLIRSWTAKIDLKGQRVDWLLTCSVETGIHEPSLASGSSIRKAALVNSDRSELTIWDVRGAQLEYTQSFESSDGIQDLDWTSTPDDQSILAVGFQHRVLLLSQLRYDYLNEGPAWTAIREINIRDLTPHPIGDSTWLGRGSLLIGAGNQLFVYDKTFNVSASIAANLQLPLRKEGQWDLFDAVTRLNGPLPVFHPQFLGQCILAGKMTMVQRILLKLYQTLKSHPEGEHIDNLLGLELEDFYTHSQKVCISIPLKYARD
jgi:WD40 repeat protein